MIKALRRSELSLRGALKSLAGVSHLCCVNWLDVFSLFSSTDKYIVLKKTRRLELRLLFSLFVSLSDW